MYAPREKPKIAILSPAVSSERQDDSKAELIVTLLTILHEKFVTIWSQTLNLVYEGAKVLTLNMSRKVPSKHLIQQHVHFVRQRCDRLVFRISANASLVVHDLISLVVFL